MILEGCMMTIRAEASSQHRIWLLSRPCRWLFPQKQILDGFNSRSLKQFIHVYPCLYQTHKNSQQIVVMWPELGQQSFHLSSNGELFFLPPYYIILYRGVWHQISRRFPKWGGNRPNWKPKRPSKQTKMSRALRLAKASSIKAKRRCRRCFCGEVQVLDRTAALYCRTYEKRSHHVFIRTSSKPLF